MKIFAIIFALSIVSACVTSPTDPAQLAAWQAEKTARTEARRPAPGSVVASPDLDPADFEELKRQAAQPDPWGVGN